MTYEIEIKETLAIVKTVEANSLIEALDLVEGKYYKSEIILDAEQMQGVEFSLYEPMLEKSR